MSTSRASKAVWFVTGSQHLYGPKVLEQVAANSTSIVNDLNSSGRISAPLAYKGTVKTPEEILGVCLQANSDPDCLGLVLWMHTFSPAKMWIAGLKALNKPWMHLHTQFNDALPWNDIDMDFMNLNQSAHGCREFGFIGTRLREERKIVVGHWKNADVQAQIDDWVRAAKGWNEGQNLKVARFGDNMRQVSVTEGNKVSAQIQFGYEVHAYGLGDLAKVVDSVSDSDVAHQLDLYGSEYTIAPELLKDDHSLAMLKNEARLELGMKAFLQDGQFGAFTNTFENLTGLTALPGLATQRLMGQGYGFGAEGDWKTAALLRIMKVMADGRSGGNSFMEDYTYNFGSKDQVLGAHMLEVCPSIAAEKPRIEVQRHTIGCKADIARLIFSAKAGPAINVSPIDLGNRFRIIVNVVDTVTPPQDLPKLPVAHALWEPRPNLSVAAAAWIIAGGAHHTVYSQNLSVDNIADYAEMAGVELVVIDENTNIREFKNELRQNAAYYHLSQGL